jgi:hypothetical protein
LGEEIEGSVSCTDKDEASGALLVLLQRARPLVALAIREARAYLNKAPFDPQHHLFINEMS